ncbi:hypothetical protein CVU82_01995 [Candidatus Falkowbacteria bacterium HGW-Falkowbacteria-1]|jgi:phosphatidylinositol alpha-1,6-mannosyltransferase|uniref:Glycosyl transferase family 1 domain-containing protein n=1 Tax=Candidatus Falkowbacteria bacterium HGW-Falkowbacteria-1 TaxID=2013768 RepID=A0A2N2E9E4_9BACT|nr:MAG: hypothetical protein CVU82_01995 [Candidatus Falkowbacteria bacterium HGW-Falkowbacteria-1]
MKFLLFTLEYFPFKGGVANYYTNLVYYWPKSSDILVLDNNNNQLIRKKGILRWLPGFFSFYRFVKKNKIKHVLVGHILPLGIIVFILADILKIKYTVFLHGMDFSLALRNKWKRFLTKLILRKAEKIVCANSEVFKMLNKFLDQEGKCVVVNPGAKDFNFRSLEKEQELKTKYKLDNKKILFSLGRLVKRKGFDYVILAFKELIKSGNDDLVYVISGKGPDEEYIKEIARKNIGQIWSDKIIFTGEITEEEKWTFLSLSDIFIMPARNISGDFEGFGIVYLEANLASKAVIAGNSGGVSDAVLDGVNGLLVNPESEEDIARAIRKLSDNKALREKLGQRGRQRVLRDFDWIKQVDKIYQFLTK